MEPVTGEGPDLVVGGRFGDGPCIAVYAKLGPSGGPKLVAGPSSLTAGWSSATNG
jgi:hypothetical protein